MTPILTSQIMWKEMLYNNERAFVENGEKRPFFGIHKFLTSKNDPTVSGLQLLSLKQSSALRQRAILPCSISHNLEFFALSNSASTCN